MRWRVRRWGEAVERAPAAGRAAIVSRAIVSRAIVSGAIVSSAIVSRACTCRRKSSLPSSGVLCTMRTAVSAAAAVRKSHRAKPMGCLVRVRVRVRVRVKRARG